MANKDTNLIDYFGPGVTAVMGSQISGLAAEDIEDLQASTHCNRIFGHIIIIDCDLVNEKEILRLYKRFKTLDRDHSGTLSTDELLSIPEFAMNPLVPTRLMAIITPGGREVSFKGFLQILSVFHPRASVDEKLKCTFSYTFCLYYPVISCL
jgi:serine/threonine-protein phosphatase 2B regulatory subunit